MVDSIRAGIFNQSTFLSTIRGEVAFSAYLPPCWKAKATHQYPLVIFLHGKGGNETTVCNTIKAPLLNEWILNNVLPPFVLIAPNGDKNKMAVQWVSEENEIMLTANKGELREFCIKNLNAGQANIAIEGHSRGAAGALYCLLKHPEKFTSVAACGYVSNYTLSTLKEIVQNNHLLKKIFIRLKIEIGSEDVFLQQKNRNCSADLYHFLLENNIETEFEILKGVTHSYTTFWNFDRKLCINGLHHLKYHLKTI